MMPEKIVSLGKIKGTDPDSDAAQCTLAGLLPYVAQERRKEFASHVCDLVDGDECFGIDHTFLGFMCDYVNYAHLLRRKAEMHNFDPLAGKPGFPKLLPPITVFDVGCATALQHVVFDPRIHYVGIDCGIRKPRFFRDNCTYVEGKFSDIVSQLDIHPQTAIGIAIPLRCWPHRTVRWRGSRAARQCE